MEYCYCRSTAIFSQGGWNIDAPLQVPPAMSTAAEAAQNTVELGKKHIVEQCQRIEQQRELIARLERDGHIDLVPAAVAFLEEMRKMLAQMEADYAGAQERLVQATVDEPSLANVEKDTPL